MLYEVGGDCHARAVTTRSLGELAAEPRRVPNFSPDPGGGRAESRWRDPELGTGQLGGPGRPPESGAEPRSGLARKCPGRTRVRPPAARPVVLAGSPGSDGRRRP